MLRTELNLQLLYQRLLPTVYRVAYTYMKNRYDSEDAAQEAFIRLARRSGSFRDEREVKAWLVVTVSNICKDMLRRKHRQDLNVDDYPELPAPQQEGNELLSALLDLPEKFKTAIYLYYYEGYAVKEIARAMGQSEGTVKSWLYRARKMLKRRLEEDSYE
jgi:RNA polymerase sigma-70 factor (ECF subfamily)